MLASAAWLLTAAKNLLRGNRLLQLDRRFTATLDGAYRRGEFYMRWFHRFSQLAFGTVLGRLLTRFVLLPFLGAFVILEGLQEITHMVIGAIIPIHAELVSRESLLVLGLYILALVNFATARTAT